VGWADRAYQRLLLQAHRRCIPVLIVSDSRLRDQPRSPLPEGLKRQLLRGYAAALVAGSESRAYLHRLGFPAGGIFEPWDVVDNRFFEQAAAQAGPRQPRFLCVSRFVDVKNHQTLLQSYATYQRQGGRWGLQLVGSGPLLPAIEAQVAALPAPGRVQLLPFCQLPELGRLYGQASAFVLASTKDTWGLVVNEAMAAGLPCLVSSACGCAVDLIEHNRTGWCFDPSTTQAMAELMHTAERQPPAQRHAMVAAARQRLEAFTPLAFAQGLLAAVDQATSQPRFSRRAALAARLLSHRP
jgi:glycosyltransferase involved in cell wall biosynthesis